MATRRGSLVIVTRSPGETDRLGRALGGALPPGGFVALTGELGSGKTVLAQGIAAGSGYRGVASSPTFVIVNEYEGRLPVYHVDLYRVSDPASLEDLGYREIFYGDGVAVVEWADRVPSLLPGDRLDAALEIAATDARRVTLTATGPVHAAALADAAARFGVEGSE
jgi:tRNA threonylcarbamoyladenosine biosynthesis protein TsaE